MAYTIGNARQFRMDCPAHQDIQADFQELNDVMIVRVA